MKNVNLEVFYSVQLVSGTDVPVYIFKTYEEASTFAAAHDKKMQAEFDRWLAGDCTISDSIAESTLESDCSGGCYQSFHVSPHCLSGGVDTHEPFSALHENWKNEPGAKSIRWGNPATARPVLA